MFSTTGMPQHFAQGYSIAVHDKGAVRRKECGTGLTSVGETRQLQSELSANRNCR